MGKTVLIDSKKVSFSPSTDPRCEGTVEQASQGNDRIEYITISALVIPFVVALFVALICLLKRRCLSD